MTFRKRQNRQKTDWWLPGAKGGVRVLTMKGHEELSVGDGIVLHLNCGGGDMTVCVCQNL